MKKNHTDSIATFTIQVKSQHKMNVQVCYLNECKLIQNAQVDARKRLFLHKYCTANGFWVFFCADFAANEIENRVIVIVHVCNVLVRTFV